ncbi:MAG TPA: Rrf2 family transcriptional regulator [Clostridia bacterium]|nr:Rrf2 family transcriptional regulator [Clostridia bacterium]
MISMTSEYALRAMVWLATQPSGRAILGRELAECSDIPANYLAKILVTLRNAGLVATARGTGGGYMLQKPADGVRLSEIVELFEGSRVGCGCLLSRSRECTGRDACSAHEAWQQVRNVYKQFLDETTLADISVRGSRGTSKAFQAAP